MLKSLSTAATGMGAQQSNMDVVANNIANVSTNGFKRSRAEFEDLMYQTIKEPGSATGANSISPEGVQIGLGVKAAGVSKDFSQGSQQVTKGAFDMSIEGKGFFPVQLPNGQVAYTRDGAFKRGADGKVQNRQGYELLPGVTVPQRTSSIEIGSDGLVQVLEGVNSDPQNIGQIQLVNFVNPAGLKSIGGNLYIPSQSSGLPQQGTPGTGVFGTVAQGQLELSNVNIVDEMVRMITAQRAYETNSKVIQSADQMLQYTNNLR